MLYLATPIEGKDSLIAYDLGGKESCQSQQAPIMLRVSSWMAIFSSGVLRTSGLLSNRFLSRALV